MIVEGRENGREFDVATCKMAGETPQLAMFIFGDYWRGVIGHVVISPSNLRYQEPNLGEEKSRLCGETEIQ